jgi:glucose/arabinose dehydrogenase
MPNPSDLITNIVNYNNFSDLSALQLNGNALGSGSSLRITPDIGSARGSAFTKTAIALAPNVSLNTQFQFQLGGSQGTNGADGFAFVIQGNSPTALGATGGNLGYSGINNSLAIEFDTYQNPEYGDVNNNHIGILRNGNMTAIAQAAVGLDLNSGAAINAWVDYNAANTQLEVYLSNTTTKPGSATLSQTIDLRSIVGPNAFVGFTGGTGGLRNAQDLRTWTLSTSVPGGPPAGNGDGLLGEYFDNRDFTNSQFTRVDSTVNFDWGRGSPDPRIAPDTFSVRWKGQVQAQYTEDYTFFTTTDDGVQLKVNGQTVVDALVDQAARERSGTIRLEAGKKYDIQLDYYENGGLASSKLAWSSASQVKQIIPKSQLFSDGGINNNLPTILLGTPTATVNENAGTVTMRLDRTGNLNVVSTIEYTTNNNSAIAPGDYTATVGTATFAIGETSKTITIPIINDTVPEGTEVFGFNLGAAGNAVVGAARTANITILDDDSSSTFELSRADFPVNEEAGTVTITVNRGGSSVGSGSVSYATSDGTAIAADYTATSGTINFAPGETSKTFTVAITNDTIGERNETFNITLSAPVGGTLATQNTATVTIADNDPGNFAREDYITGLTNPLAFEWTGPDNRTMFIAEKSGIIRVATNQGPTTTPVLQSTPFLDIRAQVNDVSDRGLLDIALHPDFNNGQPYVYLAYVYDPPEAPSRDLGLNRPARVTRVRAQQAANGVWSAVPNSEEIIVGKNSTWANISRPDLDSTRSATFDPNAPGYTGLIPATGVTVNPDGTRTNLNDIIAVDSLSHAGATLAFGPDKKLYITVGDGTSYSGTDPRTTRVQDINNLSGKVLRVDPDTGAGLSDNPFWNGNSGDNRSKVYALGLRNPFRGVFGPNGEFAIGDVGWNSWEEINIVKPGDNFGWPYFEGGQGNPIKTNSYQNLPEAQAFYQSGLPTKAAAYAFGHSADLPDALLAGAFYTGSTFPSIWSNALFVTNVAQGWIDAITFNPDGTLKSSQRFDQDQSLRYITNMETGSDGNLYYVDLDNGKVGRWRSLPGSSAVARSSEVVVDSSPALFARL